MDDNNNQPEQIAFKDIDEGFRFKILELWVKANDFYNQGEIRKGFNYYKTIFYLIQPKDFKSKETLKEYTHAIKEYLDNLGTKPVNMADKIKTTQKIMEFENLVDEYFQLIPDALDELGLYLKVIKKKDDYDEVFSEETFNSQTSLLEAKKEAILQFEKEDIVNNMKAQAIHETFERLNILLALQRDS